MLTKEIIESSIAGLPKESTVTATPAVTPNPHEGAKVVNVDVPPVKDEAKPVTTDAAPQSNSELQALLKELNISSVDELKKKVAPPPEKKSKDQELSEAIDFGIRNQKLKMDDYNEAVKLSAIPPKELVFKKFSESLKEKNAKISDEQIQKRFDAIYGEEVETTETDDDGNFIKNILYDEDGLKSEAEKIIKQAWSPIDSVKKEYSSYTENQNFIATVQKDANHYTSQIPSVIKLSIGEDSIDYAIDEKTKEKIADGFSKAYIATQIYLKKEGISNENFDFAKTLEDVVWSVAKNNIIGIYANSKVEAAKQDTLKPFTNAITQPVETLRPDAKLAPTETLDDIGRRFAQSKRGF